MTRYVVRCNGRQQGAIGIFHPLPPVVVDAESYAQANERARAICYERGYEHVFCVSHAIPEQVKQPDEGKAP